MSNCMDEREAYYMRQLHAASELRDELRAQLSAATARASELEAFNAEARDVLRHALSDFFEEEDGWIERASALCGDERLSRLKRAAKTEEVLQAALNQKTEQLAKVERENGALGERVARAERVEQVAALRQAADALDGIAGNWAADLEAGRRKFGTGAASVKP